MAYASYGGQSVWIPPVSYSSNPGSSYAGSPTVGSPLPVANNPGSSFGGQPTQGSPMPVSSGQVPGANTDNNNNDGRMTEQQALAEGIDINQLRAQGKLIEPQVDTGALERANQERIAAAMGLYEAQKGALQSQIPEYQKANDIRITGLTQGLEDFNQTAAREEASRIAGIDENISGINEQYTKAGRTTRNAAKSLADQLRKMFASRGTLDSTQYKDMNVDQSKELLQSVGDIGREKAGKLTTAGREKEDIGKYYSEQKVQQQRQVELQKDQIRQDTNSFIKETMGKINITDAQKVEAITAAKEAAASQILELSMKQQEINRAVEKDAQDLALRKQELAQKGYSSAYTDSKNTNAAITAANAAVASYEKSIGRALTDAERSQVFTNYGVADKVPKFGDVPTSDTVDDFANI